MTHEEFRERLREAAAVVETWPKWKQNIVQDSLRPTFDVPREPVVNDTYCPHCGRGGDE